MYKQCVNRLSVSIRSIKEITTYNVYSNEFYVRYLHIEATRRAERGGGAKLPICMNNENIAM